MAEERVRELIRQARARANSALLHEAQRLLAQITPGEWGEVG